MTGRSFAHFDAAPLLELAPATDDRTLAALFGVTRRTIVRWTTGRTGVCGLDRAERFAIAIGLHPASVWPEWLEFSAERVERLEERGRAPPGLVPSENLDDPRLAQAGETRELHLRQPELVAALDDELVSELGGRLERIPILGHRRARSSQSGRKILDRSAR